MPSNCCKHFFPILKANSNVGGGGGFAIWFYFKEVEVRIPEYKAHQLESQTLKVPNLFRLTF